MNQSQNDLPVRLKESASHEDFSADWSDYLAAAGNDSIASVAVPTIAPQVTGGLKLLDPPNPPGGASYGFTGAISYAWLAGGLAGKKYTLTFTINTTGGRTDTQSMIIQIPKTP